MTAAKESYRLPAMRILEKIELVTRAARLHTVIISHCGQGSSMYFLFHAGIDTRHIFNSGIKLINRNIIPKVICCKFQIKRFTARRITLCIDDVLECFEPPLSTFELWIVPNGAVLCMMCIHARVRVLYFIIISVYLGSDVSCWNFLIGYRHHISPTAMSAILFCDDELFCNWRDLYHQMPFPNVGFAFGINTWKPRSNIRLFVNDIVKLVFVYGSCCILIILSLKH